MIRRPPRSTPKPSSAASDVYKRQAVTYAESGAGIAVLPESMVKVVGQGEGTVRLLDMEPTTRVCAVWLKDRTDGCADGCSEELIQDFIGMLRGRRAHSSRSSVATQAVSHTCDDMGLSTKQARKRARQEKIRASRAQSQEQRKPVSYTHLTLPTKA